MLWWTLRQLNSNNPHARRLAAEKLLSRLLSDRSGKVVQATRRSLEKTGSAALEPLVQKLREDYYSRDSASKALVMIGDASAPALVKLLADPDRYVQEVAAKLLGEIRDPSAIHPLAKLLADKTWSVRQAAINALWRIGDPGADISARG